MDAANSAKKMNNQLYADQVSLSVVPVKVHRSAKFGTIHHCIPNRWRMHSVREPRYNLIGFRDESTVLLYKIRHNLKLINVTYSSAINTYQDIFACSIEAAGETLGYLPDAKNNNNIKN